MVVSQMRFKLPTDQFKQLYKTWEIRTVILFSLFMQVFLIFSAPFRKRTSSLLVLIPMWFAYLLADATANFAIGHMLSGGSGPPPELMAFWAPFLLVHLGGPDTITAYALEDNELWHRHLLQFGFQFGTTFYVFGHSLHQNKLWLPITLVFIAGIIKYAERTLSLYKASFNKLRDSLLTTSDPEPSYATLVDYFFSKHEANLPVRPQTIRIKPGRPDHQQGVTSLEDWEVIKYAYQYSESFKGIISDVVLGSPERDESRNFFFNRTARDAFKLVEVELNFHYETLYTKGPVVHSRIGIYARSLSFILTLAALVIFTFSGKKRFQRRDIGITYTLLYGAIALDIVALIMSFFSDWMLVVITKTAVPTVFNRVLREVLNIERTRWPEQESKGKKHHRKLSCEWFRKILRRRWCETINQHNLINYCVHPRWHRIETLYSTLGITAILDGMKFVKKKPFDNNLRNLIFLELKMKAVMADDLEIAKDLYSARGDLVLRMAGCTELLPWVSDVDFDESLLLWHVATEICLYSKGEEGKIDLRRKSEEENIDLCRKSEEKNKYRHISKLLSDYMLYLLIFRSPIMSLVAGIGQIRYKETCAEAKKIFNKASNEEEKEDLQERACIRILKLKTDFYPNTVNGYRSRSVLFNACILAKKLEEVAAGKNKDKWEIISKVWVEMLSYAACRCRANTHTAQVGRGGQLITLVWVLMAHLGIGNPNQFQISDLRPRTTLVVEK